MTRKLKILGLTPKNNYTKETPEQLYLKKLEMCGHEVFLRDETFNVSDKLCKEVDVVVAMSEVTCMKAFEISQQYNKPYYAHMEWIPDWRVFKDDEFNWGYVEKIPYYMKMNFVRMYQNYAFYWSMANIKTLAGNCFIDTMKQFVGREMVIYPKYLGPNTDAIKEYLNSDRDIPNKEGVCCIARFVPHKRISHIISALKNIGYDGTLRLVGYGDEQKHYEAIKEDINIEYYDSSEKYKVLEKSKVCVSLWSGIVPAEAMYLGTPCVTYDSEYMKELYDDTITYAKNNDIEDLGIKILENLTYDELKREDVCKNGVMKIEKNQCNTFTLENTVRYLEQLIFKTTGDLR